MVDKWIHKHRSHNLIVTNIKLKKSSISKEIFAMFELVLRKFLLNDFEFWKK